MYGGAHLFKPDMAARLGRNALAAAEQYGPLDEVFGIPEIVAVRVLDKLRTEPVEDYRIDFEDGYGYRSDAEEDGHAVAAGQALRASADAGTLPAFIGLRVKGLGAESRARSLRTLELFIGAMGAPAPLNFAVTLPKVIEADEVTRLVARLSELEREMGIEQGAIRAEIMIETPQAFQGMNLAEFVKAGEGRVRGAHFGPFDYTSSIGIASNCQDLQHPACDMARHLMQIAYAPSGLWLSDGPTPVMPVARERGAAGVHDAWRLHYRNVRHALRMGFYQGWDLHPAQLVSRYAAVYSFFGDALDEASIRLRNFVDRAAQATMVGQTFDDAATGQGLLNFFLRAVGCGALTEGEARERTGLSHGEIEGGSFAGIVRTRAQA